MHDFGGRNTFQVSTMPHSLSDGTSSAAAASVEECIKKACPQHRTSRSNVSRMQPLSSIDSNGAQYITGDELVTLHMHCGCCNGSMALRPIRFDPHVERDVACHQHLGESDLSDGLCLDSVHSDTVYGEAV